MKVHGLMQTSDGASITEEGASSASLGLLVYVAAAKHVYMQELALGGAPAVSGYRKIPLTLPQQCNHRTATDNVVRKTIRHSERNILAASH